MIRKLSTGKILNSLTHDIINIGEMADNILTIILNILKCIIIVFYFLKINILLVIFIIIVDLIYIGRNNYLNKLAIKYSKEQKNENDNLIGLINQTLLGLKDIQTLDLSNPLNNKYNNVYNSWKKAYTNKNKYARYRTTILKCFLVVIKMIIYFLLKI